MQNARHEKIIHCTNLTIKLIIASACIAFVVIQSYSCFKRYLKAPEGTKLTIEFTGEHAFPSITICTVPDLNPSKDVPYNRTNLEFCKIKGSQNYKYYTDDARWTGLRYDNCTDPKLLFENSVAKAEDVVSYIEYSYFTKDKSDRVKLEDQQQVWTVTDMRKEGRCFTATPNAEMIKHGIKEVTILLWMRARIFLHHEAFFIAERQKAFIDIPWQRRIYIDLDQEIFEFLNSKDDPCNATNSYRKDRCIHQHIHEVSMDTFGCTTPFGPDKNTICKDREIGRQALKLYQEIVEKNHTNSSCLNPCTLSFQRFIQTKDDLQPYVDKKKASVLKIASREKIKVMRAHELYLWDNLLGEVGGYVGLFLGVSFVQISDLINSFMKWWLKKH